MFRKFIKQHNLINDNDKILLAFSGGPDSVFMLERLLEIKDEYNLSLHLGYVNHKLRDDVYKDIELVEDIARKYDIDFTILEINLDKFSENEARNLRYEALEKLRVRLNFDKIATGHNKTDNAETILFRIIRGTGLKGLEGIPVKRAMIIRPILYISKEEILKTVYNKYIIDKTNNENDYSRNKIRNQVFPIFNQINEGYIDNIVKIFANISNNDKNRAYIIEELEKYGLEINSRKIEAIEATFYSDESKIIDLGKGYYWYKSYDNFKIVSSSDLEKNEEEINLKYGENISFNGYEIYYGDINKLEIINKNEYNICNLEEFSQDSIFTIRTRKNGDKLGNKKLKKLFIDNKIDKLERDNMPVILLNNTIVVVGDKFRVKSDRNSNNKCILVRRGNGR